MKKCFTLFNVFLFLIFPPLTALSEENHSINEKTLSDYLHTPFSWMHNGADLRFRIASAENLPALSDDKLNNVWLYKRYRARIWTTLNLRDDIDFNARLIWELFDWQKPGRKNGYADKNEIMFDKFSFTFMNPFDMPLKATVGRQDIIIGKGWLIFEGTPYDASRSLFFDAARFTFNLRADKTTLDLIYIDQKPEADRWINPIKYEHRDLMPAEERGFIFYLINRPGKNNNFEAYLIYKNDNPVDRTIIPATSRKAEIFTFGGAIEEKLNDRWDYRIEAAFQTGDKENKETGQMDNLKAWGLVSHLCRSFNDSYSNKIHFSFEHLSGDDPDTADNEQFDPLWGKWPQWSILCLYAYTAETSLGDITNFSRFNIGHSFRPARKWQIETNYHFLLADENNMPVSEEPSNSLEFSEAGKVRGHLLTNCIKYNFSKNISTDVLSELFSPGSYYGRNSRDLAYFIRWQIIAAF